jgi:glycosyltransferase involved in cell wall biosynthesis
MLRGGGTARSSISVIIPCYRYGHYLQEAVSSVLDDQRGVDVRVLIIDDASPDESAEVAREIASRRAEVEVIVHDTNRGNIATFNEGLLEWADGDYCLLMSADDRATPGALARASALLDAYPEVGFVYGRALWVRDGALLPPARTKGRGWTVTPGQRWLEHRFRQAENPITSPEIVVRTSLHQRVGGYDPGLPKAADMEIYMRLAAHSDVGFLRGVDQAYYRLHPQNMRKAVTSLLDLRQRRSVFELVLSRYGERIVNPSRLDDMVHRQLAREALWAAGRVYDRGSFRESEVGRRLLGGGTHEDADDVDGLLSFAVECWPEVKRLRLYRTISSGARVGPLEIQYLLNQKAQWWLRRRSWKYRGV